MHNHRITSYLVDKRDPSFEAMDNTAPLKGPLLSAVPLLQIERLHLWFSPDMLPTLESIQSLLSKQCPSIHITSNPFDPTEFLKSLQAHAATLLLTESTQRLLHPVLSTAQTDATFPATIIDYPKHILASAVSLRPINLFSNRTHAHGPSVVKEPAASYSTRTDVEEHRASHNITPRKLAGQSEAFLKILHMADTIAQHDVPILITGETGTGKGALAKYIHDQSPRRQAPFVSVNCGALPEKLIESILFGHKKGAFTGAIQDQLGKFQQAHNGTLFLDEIGELPLDLQPRLLKVLDDKLVEPLGASTSSPVDVRILSATNRDIQSMVADNLFREDLYYRLSFAPLELPPLRERREDIEPIALLLLEKLNAKLASPKQLTVAALQFLSQQSWPGNVRSLENTLGRSLVLCRESALDINDILLQPAPPIKSEHTHPFDRGHAFNLEHYLNHVREDLIFEALDRTHGNQSQAAKLLGISPQAVNQFLRTHQRPSSE